MSISARFILLIYVGYVTVESRSFYPSYNDYPPVKYNDISEEELDEVHEVHEDHAAAAAVTQQQEIFSPTVITPTAVAAAEAGYGKTYNSAVGSTGGYKYEYHINSPYTGDYKTQQEERVGDVVRGSYSFIEPDGRKRIVEYTADPIHGFNAIVKHEPANALHLQRSIRGHEIPAFHLHPTRQPAVEIEHHGVTQLAPNLVPTSPPLKPTWIPSPSPPTYPKKLFYTKPPPPTLPFKSNSTTFIAVPERPQFNGPHQFINWPFLYGV